MRAGDVFATAQPKILLQRDLNWKTNKKKASKVFSR